MEIDTSNLTDEQISKLSEFVHKMEQENKATKWWIMPQYSVFCENNLYNQFGPGYYVEPQKDTYSKSKPPLKSDFNSKGEAQEWLNKYLAEDRLYKFACDELEVLKSNISHIQAKIKNHNKVTEEDWNDCFYAFNASRLHGVLKEVTKENE